MLCVGALETTGHCRFHSSMEKGPWRLRCSKSDPERGSHREVDWHCRLATSEYDSVNSSIPCDFHLTMQLSQPQALFFVPFARPPTFSKLQFLPGGPGRLMPRVSADPCWDELHSVPRGTLRGLPHRGRADEGGKAAGGRMTGRVYLLFGRSCQ